MLYDVFLVYESKITVGKSKVTVFTAGKRRGCWGKSQHFGRQNSPPRDVLINHKTLNKMNKQEQHVNRYIVQTCINSSLNDLSRLANNAMKASGKMRAAKQRKCKWV